MLLDNVDILGIESQFLEQPAFVDHHENETTGEIEKFLILNEYFRVPGEHSNYFQEY